MRIKKGYLLERKRGTCENKSCAYCSLKGVVVKRGRALLTQEKEHLLK